MTGEPIKLFAGTLVVPYKSFNATLLCSAARYWGEESNVPYFGANFRSCFCWEGGLCD